MRRTSLLTVLALVGLAGVAAAEARPEPGYVVIVHPSNPLAILDRRFIAEAFFKKITRWGDDGVIQPVDLPDDSPVRQRFARDVVGRSIAAIKSYWQQQIFAGEEIPPLELVSDQAVVRYVVTHPGAIGYVAVGVDVGAAKIVSLR
jgi:ABC-type phosphate transport system substrate-binding protein